MTIRIPNSSRLRAAGLMDIDGVQFWDLIDYPAIVPQDNDLVHTVTQTDRIDLLSYQYYGTPIHWWVIAAANDMEVLPTDLHVAEDIIIPAPSYVLSVIIPNLKPVEG